MSASARLLAVVLPVALAHAAIPGPTWAADIVSDLLHAAELIPVDDQGRRLCRPVQPTSPPVGIPFVREIPGEDAYSIRTHGAYFGDGPPGPAPPLVQALIDAGWVQALRFEYEQHRSARVGAPPAIQGARMLARTPEAAPGLEDQLLAVTGEAWVATGPEQELFMSEATAFTPYPARIVPLGKPADRYTPPDAALPPGVRWATRLCLTLRPDRVLEWGDLATLANGVREVSAFVLFHPEPLPAWAMDWRTWPPNGVQRIERDIVRLVSFRDDGDGWLPQRLPRAGALHGTVNLVDQR